MSSPIASTSAWPKFIRDHDSSSAPQCSLLLAHRPQGRLVIIVGTGRLAFARARAVHEAGGVPVIVSMPEVSSDISDGVKEGWIQWQEGPKDGDGGDDVAEWSRWIDAVDEPQGEDDERRIFAVCITDTLHSGDDAHASKARHGTATINTSSASRTKALYSICKRRRIPINVADTPSYCDFSFPASHRYPSSSLQIAVTTNGRGCRLAGRIRRDIVSALPRNVGDAVERVGEMRELAKRDGQDNRRREAKDYISARPRTAAEEEDDLSYDTTPLNSPVPQMAVDVPPSLLHRTSSRLRIHQEIQSERTKRRMRWVAQISEYWPIQYLGNMTSEQMHEALASFGEQDKGQLSGLSDGESSGVARSDVSALHKAPQANDPARGDDSGSKAPGLSDTFGHNVTPRSQHSLSIVPPPLPTKSKGQIYLIGSGPGHPGLLTLLAHRLLTSSTTHLVLSDKLVPAPILRLIPSTTPLVIAKKFPGNAEGAQSELISLALRAALEEGKNVVRLKQGDPFVYGRGGEEVLAFRRAGIECTVIPGISSALAAPLMLGVPVTQRGSADSLILCTGVGRGGKKVKLPGYERGRSVVVLMGVARLRAVVDILTSTEVSEDRTGAPFPPYTPIAIIERASSSDQRILASTLDKISLALDKCGEQRPPGMIMIGWAVLSLEGKGHVDVLSQEDGVAIDATDLEKRDRARVAEWLGSKDYIMREGLDDVYAEALIDLAREGSEAAAGQENRTGPSTQPHTDNGGSARSVTGWSKGRYGDVKQAPRGGWSEGEEPNVPALDAMEYRRHLEYLDRVAST